MATPAGLELPPHGHVTFVSFERADYELDLVLSRLGSLKSARVKSQIRFNVAETGRPALDFSVQGLDLDDVDATLTTQAGSETVTLKPAVLGNGEDREDRFCVIDKVLDPGDTYELVCDHDLHTNEHPSHVLGASDGNVRFRLRMMDRVGSTRFCGAYWPSNFEHDQFPSSLTIAITDNSPAPKPHRLLANGAVTTVSGKLGKIDFPDWYTCSFPYVDVISEQAFFIKPDTHAPPKGVAVPLVVYASKGVTDHERHVDEFIAAAKSHLQTLESQFGPFPHERVIINAREGRGGGMEYAGATDTDLEFLYHELNHSYFARCLAPADGNSGWIDEAIAVWCDPTRHDPPPRRASPPARKSGMGGRRTQERLDLERGTDTSASGEAGLELMAHLDHLLAQAGQSGLMPALKYYFTANQRKSVTTAQFEQALGNFLPPAEVKDLFDKFVRAPS